MTKVLRRVEMEFEDGTRQEMTGEDAEKWAKWVNGVLSLHQARLGAPSTGLPEWKQISPRSEEVVTGVNSKAQEIEFVTVAFGVKMPDGTVREHTFKKTRQEYDQLKIAWELNRTVVPVFAELFKPAVDVLPSGPQDFYLRVTGVHRENAKAFAETPLHKGKSSNEIKLL